MAKGLRPSCLVVVDARWTYPHFAHDHDSLRYSVRYAMMVDLQRESWTWRPNPNAPALPMRQYGTFNPGQGLGGAAVHWSGQLWRYQETAARTGQERAACGGGGASHASLSRTTFHPWVDAQGHSPFVWSVIGAIGQATSAFVSAPRSRAR